MTTRGRPQIDPDGTERLPNISVPAKTANSLREIASRKGKTIHHIRREAYRDYIRRSDV